MEVPRLLEQIDARKERKRERKRRERRKRASEREAKQNKQKNEHFSLVLSPLLFDYLLFRCFLGDRERVKERERERERDFSRI